MADGEDDSQKTEDPTQKKLEESREKGDAPVSKEINNWVMLLAGTIVVIGMGGTMMNDLSTLFKEIMINSFQLHGASGGIGHVLSDITWEVLTILIVPVLFFIFMAIMGPFAQVGPMFSPKAIQPKLSKISVMEGFKRLFSMRSIFEFVKGVLKIFIIGAVSVILLYPFLENVDHFIGLPIPYMMEEFRVILFRLMAGILVVLFVLAVIDLLYQRMEHMKKMRMSIIMEKMLVN